MTARRPGSREGPGLSCTGVNLLATYFRVEPGEEINMDPMDLPFNPYAPAAKEGDVVGMTPTHRIVADGKGGRRYLPLEPADLEGNDMLAAWHYSAKYRQ